MRTTGCDGYSAIIVLWCRTIKVSICSIIYGGVSSVVTLVVVGQ